MNKIKKSWLDLAKPNKKESYTITPYLGNIYFVKDKSGRCGIMLDDIIGNYKDSYINIEIKKYKVLESKSGIKSNCLVVINKETISSELFVETILTNFEQYERKNKYGVQDLKKILEKLKEITLSTVNKLNEIIGAWGELKTLYELIKVCDKDDLKEDIIESWESPDNRSLIDFNFVNAKQKLEIKTTTQDQRIHHIIDLNQVTNQIGFTSYLASHKIKHSPTGISCSDLLGKIKKQLNENLSKQLEDRIKIRGESLCSDSHYKFIIQKNSILYFKFESVPKPTTMNGVGKISFETVLENIKSVGVNELKKFNDKITKGT